MDAMKHSEEHSSGASGKSHGEIGYSELLGLVETGSLMS